MTDAKIKTTEQPRFASLGLFGRVGLLFVLFFCMLCLVSFISQIIVGKSVTPGMLLAGAAVQNVVAFFLTSFLFAYLTETKPLRWLGVDVSARWYSYPAMIIVFIIGLPFLNQIIQWNANVSLPESMAALESSLKAMEKMATDMTNQMLSGSSVADLVIEILIIGILTGFCEEILFRAGLQNLLAKYVNRHAAIWIAAFVFSVVHFQFFGFVPRLLLGAFFGYLYAASGSIWLSATAHAFNNSVVVVTNWLTVRYGIAVNLENWGVIDNGFPWPTLLSLAIVVIVSVLYWNKLFPYGKKTVDRVS